VYTPVAKIRFERSVKIDSLGKWQNPILDAVKENLGGSQASYAVVPFGRAALVVYWKGFEGYDIPERQKIVHEAISALGEDALRRVSMILALTPAEAAELENE